jgi:hypothetical protein
MTKEAKCTNVRSVHMLFANNVETNKESKIIHFKTFKNAAFSNLKKTLIRKFHKKEVIMRSKGKTRTSKEI